MKYFYSGIQKITEHLYRNQKGVNIYMFHQVNDNISKWKDRGVCITVEGFSNFIHALRNRKCDFLSMDELNQNNLKTDQSVVITFDDIFEDAYKFAFPILIDYKIPFCVFVSEYLVDTENYITGEELDKLSREPLCTIGYHTKNHLLMRLLTTEQVEFEVDCRDFEEKIGKEIKYFAFPYGSVYACSKKSIKIVKKKKYSFSFSTIAVPCTKRNIIKYSSFLPRINVAEENYKTLLERYHT
jgi:peptidoglycan/xylan/chitin deacetylase (PgdA/CDA1 family)